MKAYTYIDEYDVISKTAHGSYSCVDKIKKEKADMGKKEKEKVQLANKYMHKIRA